MLTDNQKKILQTLNSLGKPAGGKELSAASGVDEKTVAKEIGKMKTMGFVDTPIRCKYGVTEEGKKQI